MAVNLRVVLLGSLALAVGWAVIGTVADAAPVDEPARAGTRIESTAPSFKTEVMPVLRDACVRCHSGRKKKGGVDLSSYEAVLKSVKVNEPDKSRLVKSVTGRGAKLMPPKKGLAEAQVKIIKEWISAGARND